MIQLLKLEGLINGNMLIMHKLKVLLDTKTIKVHLFNQMVRTDCTFVVVSANYKM